MIKILTFFIALIATFLMAITTHALDSTSSAAAKYGVTFPVEELGGCSDLSSCRTYCEDPLNHDACINFAKKKGFYKQSLPASAGKEQVLAAAKTELGCDSESSCKAFCGEQANWEKCGEFAKKHKLAGGQTEDPAKAEILGKAKEVLSCDSVDSCKGFCQKDENKQKCDEFAKLVGLRGGLEKKGPGGCTSEETCKAFCADPQNFQLCQGFASSHGDNFKGPGGCNSESSCKSYCQKNEDECKKYFKGYENVKTKYDPQERCSKTPNCKWADERCECRSTYSGPQEAPAYENADEHARFCREFPQKCASSGTYSSSPTPYKTPSPSYTPYPIYSATPTPTSAPTPTPASSSGSSSSGDGSFCEGGDGNYFSKGTCKDASGVYTDYCDGSTVRSWYCTGTWNGTSWSNRHCEAGGYVCSSAGYNCSDGVCVGGSTTSSTPTPAPTTSGTTGVGSSVLGVDTIRTFFQNFLDSFK